VGKWKEKVVVACCWFLTVAPSGEQLLAAGNKEGFKIKSAAYGQASASSVCKTVSE